MCIRLSFCYACLLSFVRTCEMSDTGQTLGHRAFAGIRESVSVPRARESAQTAHDCTALRVRGYAGKSRVRCGLCIHPRAISPRARVYVCTCVCVSTQIKVYKKVSRESVPSLKDYVVMEPGTENNPELTFRVRTDTHTHTRPAHRRTHAHTQTHTHTHARAHAHTHTYTRGHMTRRRAHPRNSCIRKPGACA